MYDKFLLGHFQLCIAFMVLTSMFHNIFVISDPIPPADGQIHFLTGVITNKACSSMDESKHETMEIRVKNCVNYRVYYLTPPPVCPAKYCLG